MFAGQVAWLMLCCSPAHLVDDERLCDGSEWLVEKRGTKRRRTWRKLPLGVDAETGQIVASTLTSKAVDDGAQVGLLLDQVTASLSSFTADGAYDQDSVYAEVADRHSDAAVIVPARITAVPSAMAATTSTQRDHHLECIAEKGRAEWQTASGYTVEAVIERWKQVIGDGLRLCIDERRTMGVDVAVPCDLAEQRGNPTGPVILHPANQATASVAERHDPWPERQRFLAADAPATASLRPGSNQAWRYRQDHQVG